MEKLFCEETHAAFTFFFLFLNAHIRLHADTHAYFLLFSPFSHPLRCTSGQTRLRRRSLMIPPLPAGGGGGGAEASGSPELPGPDWNSNRQMRRMKCERQPRRSFQVLLITFHVVIICGIQKKNNRV